MTVWVRHARLFHSFRERGNFRYQIFLQGSVAACARRGEIVNTDYYKFSGKSFVRWKNLRNRLSFDGVTAMSLVRDIIWSSRD